MKLLNETILLLQELNHIGNGIYSNKNTKK